MAEPTPPLDLDALEARECNLAHSCECHNDVPALVARVRALEAENTLLRRIIHQHGITWFEPSTITADDEA